MKGYPMNVLRSFISVALVMGATAAQAQISIDNAWARSTVPGQKATGVFMTIASEKPVTLVKASSPAIKTVEVHEMKVIDGVMKMREVAGVEVLPGKVTELKPGGYHVMLMNLEAPISAGSKVPLLLTFKDAAGKESSVKIEAEVRERTAPSSAKASGHAH
jgi:hypothetical protein